MSQRHEVILGGDGDGLTADKGEEWRTEKLLPVTANIAAVMIDHGLRRRDVQIQA